MNIICGLLGVWCSVAYGAVETTNNGLKPPPADPGPPPFCGVYGEPILLDTYMPGPPVWSCIPKQAIGQSSNTPVTGGIEMMNAFQPPANSNCESDETAILVPTGVNIAQWRCAKTDAIR